MEKEAGLVAPKKKKVSMIPAKMVPPLPSATPEARKPAVVRSVTRDEIDKYWMTRRMIEEDHLLAAEKAAARIRAKALKAGFLALLLSDVIEAVGVVRGNANTDGLVCFIRSLAFP